MTSSTICFIGGGNMASSLIGGLIANDYPAENIIVSDIDTAKLSQLQADFGVRTEPDNALAVAQSDIVMLAVKPQILQAVCRAMASACTGQLFISIAAGVREIDINRWLGGAKAVVRCMPNTPALVSLGASALFANNAVTDHQKQQAQDILAGVGLTVWVNDENELDAVTAISGSGPAYFFLFIEALQKAASQLGLAEQTAADLARQTALGAATMAMGQDVVTLRHNVTSKGGTTEQAIISFEHNGLERVVLEATQAAAHRSRELADLLSRDNDH